MVRVDAFQMTDVPHFYTYSLLSLHYPVIKLHFDKERVAFSGDMEPYLNALLEAMKTKPKSVERTMTYYPEAVVLTEVELL